jgi:uncharacterized protein
MTLPFDLRPLQTLLTRIEEQVHPEQVWLFVSRARGNVHSDSDWDLFLVLPDSTEDEKLEALFLWNLQRGCGVAADVLACRASDFHAAKGTVNTLSYEVEQQGTRIDGRG